VSSGFDPSEIRRINVTVMPRVFPTVRELKNSEGSGQLPTGRYSGIQP